MSGVVDLPVELEVEGKENKLKAFLKKLSLEDKFKNFQSNGLSEIEHLQDIHEKDIDMLGLTAARFRFDYHYRYRYLSLAQSVEVATISFLSSVLSPVLLRLLRLVKNKDGGSENLRRRTVVFSRRRR